MPMEINDDYRNTTNCPILTDVAHKKSDLEAKIRADHPHARIMYNFVHKKGDVYFEPFSKIYNHKCAYCGVLIGIADIRLFEVDHFICEDSFPGNTEGRIEAGKVSNLVLACYSCNRGKGDLMIDQEHQRTLNPDDGSIARVFDRDEDYYICIRQDYAEDPLVVDFYQKLLLGSEFRRLDYLLLEMKNFISTQRTSNPTIAAKLEQCLCALLMKRNKTLNITT
jgi:5-methylcytosine-specific restriction endonuclease McrA